jgi:hypothetical protein
VETVPDGKGGSMQVVSDPQPVETRLDGPRAKHRRSRNS